MTPFYRSLTRFLKPIDTNAPTQLQLQVKNVATLELGEYQMDTWYFSPLPKELLKDGGMIDVLYVVEFLHSQIGTVTISSKGVAKESTSSSWE